MTTALSDSGGAALPAENGLAIGRGQLFFWTSAILVANALAGLALGDVDAHGLTNSLINLFGISAITILAWVALLTLVKDDPERGNRTDLTVAALCIAAAFLPNAAPARFMVSMLGGYLTFSSASGSPTRRAGIILIALGGALFWGTFILATLGHPMLELDAILTSQLYGLERVGNTLDFADGTPGGIIIAGGCSSWHGLSIALLFWVLLYQWFEIPVRKSSFLWLALAMALTVMVNSLRLAAMASYPAHFEEIHVGYGATIASWSTMLLVVTTCVFGERREIFAR